MANEKNNSVSSDEQASSTRAASIPIDEPPPAYEAAASSNIQENSNTIKLAEDKEAPPPYCLVDLSKVRNTDHIPHHLHITPVEVIDLNGANAINSNGTEETTHENRRPIVASLLSSGSTMDIGTDCTFIMAFIIAFFFDWLGFLAIVCIIPNIAARLGAMSGFGLSIVKWIISLRYYEFKMPSNHSETLPVHPSSWNDPAHVFLFSIVLFAGSFLFTRGIVSYLIIKRRAREQGQTRDTFTWY